jgi:HSP20 family molecular chaperone IbpA
MNSLIPVTRMLDALSHNYDYDNVERSENWTTTPRADILEGEKDFRIVLDLPGVANKNLELNLEHQTLTVKAERTLDVPEGFTSRRAERAGKLTYARSFRLGSGIDLDGIKASLRDGVLEITLPKSEQGLPRRIEIT